MNSDAKISFVMPAYNCADTIEEAVESIMKTNFRDGDELIIVNDGSTDSTQAVILKLQKKYLEIKLINNGENIGCPATRNVGIMVAVNPFIFNMDADDILAENSVTPLKKCLIKNGADVALFAESRYFKRNTKHVTHKAVTKGGVFTLADHLAGPVGPGGNCLYTKASWGKMGGYDEYGKGLHEYWGFFLKQLSHGAKFFVLADSFYFHRYGQQSLYTRESQKKDESGLVATKMITPYLDLINDDDRKYILSDDGSKNWFGNLSSRPIRVRSGEVGVPGKKIFIGNNKTLADYIKNIIPSFLRKPVKKTYFYFKKHFE